MTQKRCLVSFLFREMTYGCKELTLLPEIDEKEVQQIVIKELKQYLGLKIREGVGRIAGLYRAANSRDEVPERERDK